MARLLSDYRSLLRPVVIPDGLKDEYARENREKTAQAVWVVSWIAFILYPISAPMDYVSYPLHFWDLFVVRFSECGALALFIVPQVYLRAKGLASRYSTYMMYILVAIICVSLDLFAIIAGGGDSPYYAGITLLLVAVLVVCPWSPLRVAALVGFVIIQFDVVVPLFDDSLEWRGYFNANYFFISTVFIGLFWAVVGNRLRASEFLGRKAIEREKMRSDALLLNILPLEVADELKASGKVEARHIGSCTILFTDFVGFTRLADRVPPGALVESLDSAFSGFDSVITRWGLEKLKTIGDAYMCAGGVLERQPDHLLRCLLAALEMQRLLHASKIRAADGARWSMRIGIHSGPVVAGVIGQKKFAFDLWGDTVNTASRLESSGQPKSINLSTGVYRKVERFFVGVDRGFVPVRGKGPMAMTRLTRLRPEFSRDEEGFEPNEAFWTEVAQWVEEQEARGTEAAGAAPGVARGQAAQDIGGAPLHALSELTPDDQDLLRGLMEPLSFSAGQVLVEQGQSLHTLFLLSQGVAAVRLKRDEISVEVGLLHPGEIIGELSFVSWEPAAATVVALEPVVAYRLDLDTLREVMVRHPETGIRFYHSLSLVLARRVRETNARLFDLWGTRERQVTVQAARHAMAMRHAPKELESVVREFRTAMQTLDERPGMASDGVRQGVGQALERVLTTATAAGLAEGDVGFVSGIAAYVMRETYPWLMRSNTLERIHTRPLNIPLDHISVERILGRRPQGHGKVGEAVDAWFLEGRLAAGVRGCTLQTTRQLLDDAPMSQRGSLKVAVLSCGAGSTILDLLRKRGRPEGLSVTCMDTDLTALSAVGRRASQEGFGSSLVLVSSGLSGGRLAGAELRLPAQHRVVLPLASEVAAEAEFIRLLDEVHANLVPGGLFAFGLPTPQPSDLFLASHMLGWPVATWTVAELKRIAVQSAFGDQPLYFRTDEDGNWTIATICRAE